MLQRTKYNRFRNDSVTSVDELIHNLSKSGSGGSKVSTVPETSPASPYLVSSEALRKAPDDGPSSLGHLLHKVSHLKLSSSGLRSLSSAARERAGAKLTGSCSAPSLAAGARDRTCAGAATPGSSPPASSVMSSTRKGRSGEELLPRPPRGWLHTSDQVLGPGVTYVVKYLGCIEVLRSMRSLDFSTRTQITREAISRVCEAVPGAKGAFKKRKPSSKMLSSILGKSNLQFAGMSISLTISTTSLNLRTPDSKQIIANHHMQSISFASGGDLDTTDYVAYVAKDPVNRRACHILECCGGLAQDVISSIGQAFELRFKQYLQCPSKIPALHDRMQSLDEPWTEEEGDDSDHPYYNNITNKVPPTRGFHDTQQKARPYAPDTTQFAGKEQTYYQGRHVGDKFGEDWQQPPVRQGSSDIYSMPEGKLFEPSPEEAPTYINTQCIPQHAGFALAGAALNTGTRDEGSSGESSPQKDLFDMKPFEDALKNQSLGHILSKAASIECISPVSPRAPDAKMMEELKAEPWYQGEMSRKEAEGLLKKDGDFLVRKSSTNTGSFVLTGMHNGQAKHLLLVDPEGMIRTKDRVFDSIGHLINHHLENNLPIISAGSELCLQQPVEKKQ
ncbi:PREDICTED: SHC-transforming protein 3 [Chrysochloris asiatica]|uniref:SHC-transforming protein 3 n=1 Tax=Chrysochloris asiatica TaxID=185453 RepID=A0A9B0U5C2_CHRAS|nr:PREDICTED: SHC-transforming protein 3 [Chrysochloris asiatica]